MVGVVARVRSGVAFVALAHALLLGLAAGFAQANGSTPTMIISSRSWTTDHFYSTSSAGTWGPRTLISTYPDEGKLVVAADCPTRNEIAIGVLDYSNAARVGFYSGGTFVAPVTVCSNTKTSDQRPMYLAYEANSRDLIVAYWREASNQVAFRTASGTTLSGESVMTLPTTSDVRFLKLIAKPKSDTVVLLTGHGNKDLYATIWNGSSFGAATVITSNMGTGTDKTEPFDMAFENISGDGLLVYGVNVGGKQPAYRTLVGTTWSAQVLIPTVGDDAQWVRVAARPGTDDILMACQTNSMDVYMNTWNGTGWNVSCDVATYNTGSKDARRFDLAFQRDGVRAVLLYSDASSIIKFRTWTPSAWSIEQSGPNIGSVPLNVQVTPAPSSSDLLAAVKESDWDLNAFSWNGSAWTAPSIVNDDPGGELNTQSFMVVAPDRNYRVTSWRLVDPN